MPNEFKRPEFYDHEIVSEAGKVGDVRIKPSGILWSPKGAHKWFRASLEDFAAWIEANGTEQKK
jgi:hypothetical protein